MSFKIGILVCLILMVFMACITYYLSKKVSKSLMKYIPFFSFAIGVLFFYIKLNFISHEAYAYVRIFDMITIIILMIVGSFAFLEAVIIEIAENSKLFGKSYMGVRKAIKSVNGKKVFMFKLPSRIVKKIRS
ncbi:hypothetical protein ACIQYS_17335 [Psychrobacillus sp. NPDC096426]|uniref:hypothetical protein n=1 Tax=Psychrobacillus sp. NPDC096426 TaxID=3364491 RepID=UPI00381FE304